MILVGRHLSPFVRRAAVSLRLLGIPYRHEPLSTVDDREAIRAYNPLVRVPALVLADGEVLIDSGPILDHIDQLAGPERALVPPAGAPRRRVLRLMALAMGVAEKTVSGFYERSRRPAEKRYDAWVEQCDDQVAGGLAALEVEAGATWLAGERLTQADVSTVCALCFVRKVAAPLAPPGRYPRLDGLAERCAPLPAFADTAP